MKRSVRAALLASAAVVTAVALTASGAAVPAFAGEREPEPGPQRVEGWTPTSYWVANADGTVTRTFYPDLTFHSTADGTWEPVDATLVAAVDESEPDAATVPHGVRPLAFGRDASRLLELRLDGGDVRLSAPGVRVDPPEVAQRSVSFVAPKQHATVSFDVGPHGVKHAVTLADKTSPTTWRFHLSDPKGALGRPVPSGGGYTFDRPVADGLHLRIDAPIAYQEATGPVPGEKSATLKVIPRGDGYDIVESVDPTWLKGKSFPIVLDPSLTYVGSSQVRDCAVTSAASGLTTPDCANGASQVGADATGARRLLLRYDTSGFPTPSQVTAASVLLTPTTGSNVAVQLHEAGAEWTTGATWLSADGSTGWPVGTSGGAPQSTVLGSGTLVPGSGALSLTSSALTTLVADWISGSATNNGLVLKASSETAPGPGLSTVAMTENGTATARPALQITYNAPPDTPGSLFATRGDQAASLTWTAPANNGSAITGYTVKAYTSSGLFSTTTAGAAATGTTVTGLTNGTPYWFTVAATNGIGTGAAATSNTVTPAGVPFAPTGVSATRGDQSATVAWTAAAANGSSVTGNVVKAYSGASLVSATNVGAVTTATVTGLINGTAYTFTVSATNSVGTGAASTASNTVTPAGVPFAPTGVTAAPGDGAASVTWTAAAPNGSAVTGNTVSAYAGATLVTTATVGAVTSATVTGLTNGTAYTFKVAATNGVGAGAQSGASSAVVAGTPTAPAGVTATRGDQSATVSWTASAQNGATVSGYDVRAYAGATLVSTTNAGGTATSATVTGLTNGTSYTFTVTATNVYGAGPVSAPSAAVTPAGVPFAPSNVTATRGDTQATVTWTAASANGSPVTGYTVKAYDGATLVSTQSVGAAATSATVTGLTNGTAYSFSVAATNAVGTGPTATSNTVTPAGLPFAPSNVAATGGDQSLTVTWTAPSGNGAALTGYTVKTYTGSTLVSTTPAGAGATSATVTGLTNGTAYYATVAASNAVGTGGATTSNTVTPAGLPGAPTGVTANRGDSSASVAWTAPGANGSAVTSYTVKVYSGTTLVATHPVTAPATSTTVTGLTNGTSYTFKVSATNAVGTGADSAASNAVTPAGVPLAPSGVTATGGDQSAGVAWTAASGNGTSVTGYAVKTYQGTTLVSTTNVGNVTSATVTGLINGTAYTFTVAATNSVGAGPASAASNAVTPAGAPFAPTSVTAEPGNAAAVVGWTVPGANGSAITSYTVSAYDQGVLAQTATITAPATSGSVSGLVNGHQYTFKVAATNAAGTGAQSAASAAIVVGVAGAPTGVTAVRGDSLATVSWTAPPPNGSAITQYEIHRWRNGVFDATTVSAAGNGTTVTVSGLTNGSSYAFRVAAVNVYGTGPWSAQTSNVVPAGAPLAPTGVTATAGDQVATVSWSPSNANGATVTGYVVKAYAGATLVSTTDLGNVTSTTISGLANGTAYTFAVSGVNDVGTGAPGTSNAVTPNGVPFAPATVTAVAGDTTATVSWTAANANGAPLSEYRIVVTRAGVAQAPINVDGAATQTTVTGLTNGQSHTVTVTPVNKNGVGPSTTSNSFTPAASTVAAGFGQFVPLSPARVVDTRSGLGGSTTALAGGSTQSFTLVGVGGVPEKGVTAVAISIAGISPTTNAYLTVWPRGKTRPGVSQLSLTAGTTYAGMVIAKLGEYGQVNVYASAGSQHVIIDVQGYYTDNTATTGASRFAALSPARTVDTRNGLGNGTHGTNPLGVQETRSFNVLGVGGVPATNVESVAVAVTATGPTANGYLKVFRTGDPLPTATNVNTTTGQTATALAQVEVGDNGTISVYNVAGQTDVLFDVQGYYTRATGSGYRLYVPVDPARIYNTTNGFNTGSSGTTAIGSTQTRSVLVAGAQDVNSTTIVPSGATAAVLSIQAVTPTNPGWFQGYPAGESRPTPGSILNYGNAGYNYSGTFIAKIGTNGQVNFFASTGSVHLIVDVIGYYQGVATLPPFTPLMSSTAFPQDAWAASTTTSGQVNISANGPDRFLVSLDDPAMTAPTSVDADFFGDGAVTITPGGGWHTLYVQGVNDDNTTGPIGEYSFGAGKPGITSPTPGTHHQSLVPLSARAKSGFSGVTWNWRRGGSETFQPIPASHVKNGGSAVAAWPVAATQSGIDSTVPTLLWNAPQTLVIDGPVELQACFTPTGGGTPTCTTPTVTVMLDRGGDSTVTSSTEFGPGALNLVTGHLTVGATDVGISSFASDLSVSRSYNTGSPVRAVPGAYEHLSENQAEAESGTTGFNAGRVTLASATSPVFSQSRSLKISPNATGASNDTYAAVGGDSGALRLDLRGGHSYTLTTHIWVDPSLDLTYVGNSLRAAKAVAFWKVNAVSNEAATAPLTNADRGKWVERTLRFTVPAGSTEAFVRLYNGAPTADLPGGATTKWVAYDKTSLTEEGLFGPGWVPTLPVAAANASWAGLTDRGSVVQVHDADGSLVSFSKNAAGQFKPTGDHANSGLLLKPTTITNGTAATWTVTDLDGNAMVFVPSTTYTSAPTSTGPHAYRIDRVVQPGTALTTTYRYDTESRITEMLAPGAPGSSCTGTSWTKGCRSLVFSYSPNGTGHLTQIQYKTTTAAGAALLVAVACYSYDEGTGSGNTGLLLQHWDPRVTTSGGPPTACSSPVLPTTYGYTAGRLTSVAQPGLAATTLTYDTAGRVATSARTHNSTFGGGTETESVRYDVPVTPHASLAYYRPNMSAATVAAWGQTDVPVSAVAVFAPGDTVSADDLRDADVFYLNATGRTVNTASFGGVATDTDAAGWRIGMTAYNVNGDVIQTLDPENRELALNPSAAPTGLTLPSGSAAAAAALSTVNVYSSDGMDLTDTFGPFHLATLPDGTVAGVRSHTRTTYDNGSELGHPPGETLHLEVSSYTAASRSSAAVATSEVDKRTTATWYALSSSDTSGWTFRRPLRVVRDPSGLAITGTTRIDPRTGLVVEERMPSNPAGDTAGSTRRIYYTSDATSGDPACDNRPEWAHLLCKQVPVAQPAAEGTPGLAGLPTRHLQTYDYLSRPTVVAEVTPGGPTRTTTTTFENGGYSPRVAQVQLSGGTGTAIAAQTSTYDAATGLTAGMTNGTSSVTNAYDDFGRAISYNDGSGAGATTTTYDASGRVWKIQDDKGTQTFTYNEGGERRDLPTSLAVTGITQPFRATYDADGVLETQTWPNGVTQTYTHNQAGNPVALSVKQGTGVWLDESVSFDAHGNARTRAATVTAATGSQGGAWTYTYDAGDRLTKVTDKPTGAGCTTRVYAFDANSNRLSSTSYPAGAGNACQETAGGTSVSHRYDTADRLLGVGADAGLAYDAFGRITSLPGAHTTNGTGLSISYYANDYVRTITQGTNSQTWTLDAAGRLAGRTDQSGNTMRYHYADNGDSPSWTSENTSGSLFTRNVTGLDGSLVATLDQSNAVTWNVVNLHGDVVATTPGTAAAPSVGYATDEFGVPQGASAGRYGWLGGKRRAADGLGGLVMMGVRLYSPVMGRFLQVDPLPGGNSNAYDYVNQDPVNAFDLDGRWGIKGFSKWAKKIAFVATVVTIVGCGATVVCGLVMAAATTYCAVYSTYSAIDNAFVKGDPVAAAWDVFDLATMGSGKKLKAAKKAEKKALKVATKKIVSKKPKRIRARQARTARAEKELIKQTVRANFHAAAQATSGGRAAREMLMDW